MSNPMTRRAFLADSAAVGGGLIAATAATRTAAALGANEKVRLGFIGCGVRGPQLLQQFRQIKDAQVVACCDVYRSRAEAFKAAAGGNVEVYTDFRKLLERKDVDAVVVATNGHWHCLPTIYACRAGKDVYVEKPLACSIGEGRKMVEAARKYDRIVYIGAQQRHIPHYQEAIALIQEGKIGDITEVRSWNLENWAPDGFGSPPDTNPPADLDWEFWLGPAPKAAFNPNRLNHHYWFWDYGGGWQSEWAIHMNDVTQWAMKVDAPLSVVATGGKWARKDNTQLPDTLEVLFEYPGFVYNYSFRQGNARPFEPNMWYGNAFYGTEGTLLINRETWCIVPEGAPDKPRCKALQGKGGTETFQHQQAFIDCVKAHKRSPASDVEIGHRSTILGHLANISYRVGRKVHWDPVRKRSKATPRPTSC